MTKQLCEQIKKQKDNAYWERNQLVAALSKLLPAHLAKHPESDKDWDDDWRTIVVVYLEGNMNRDFIGQDKQTDLQMTWHIHDSDIPLFDHLYYKTDFYWDGHTTEEKYRRLRKIKLPNEQ